MIAELWGVLKTLLILAGILTAGIWIFLLVILLLMIIATVIREWVL